MSFYFDDDDDDFYGSQGKSIKKDDDRFVCASCGGTESYMDETTGILTCTVCFTQSQNYVAPSQMEMDMEDAIGLAGRNRGGQLIAGGNRTRKRKRPKKSFEEHDSTVRLPDTLQCIQGMQRILEESTRIVCRLVGEMDSFLHVLTTVKDMWQAYLLSWKEGADHFAKLYPDVRFSFRDQFLDGFQRSALSKTLSYMAAKRLKQQIMDEESQNVSTVANIGSSEKKDVENIAVLPCEDDPKDGSEQAADVFPTSSQMESERSQMVQVICRHLKQKKGASHVGRKEGALMLQPSMTMVVAILIVAVTPIGITMNQILRWVENGSLPLRNGFSLLRESDKEPLKTISSFFNLPTSPPVHLVERMVRNLHVACGFKQRRIILNTKTSRRVETSASKLHKPGRTMIPAHVPVIAASLVSDLGLSQQVLNYALSMMGKSIVNEHCDPNIAPVVGEFEKFWLPPPLKKARLDLILDINKILAIIVVACKLIPGWENMTFDVPNGASSQDSSTKLAVPIAAGEFQYLKAGSAFDGYLDFFETQVLNSDEVVMPTFAKSLKTKPESQASTIQKPPNKLLVSRTAANAKEKHSAVGTHKYLFSRRPSTVGTLAWQMDPPLGLLLEYIANKTATNPIDILDFVAELDEEIARKCKKYKCEL
ncbi:MAG: hypothetical protein SGBAC_009236 [Bacillariaceae sp.]